MNDPNGPAHRGPSRDFVGYGPEPPDFDWPGGARLAINLVVNYEEGGEYSLNEDGVNDTWGEYSFQYGPSTDRTSVISEPKRTWSTGAGWGYGGSAA